MPDDTTTYTYTYNGGQLTQMTVGSDTLTFTYDASGNPQTVTYGGTTYYYVTNLQGDVIAILNSAGTKVASYTYDAWGNSISGANSTTSTLGTLNPLRYRGYVYDHETGLYYLQSRYYNPKVGRFINADILLATGQGMLGNNMFTYCLNNPVMQKDPTGEIAITTLILIGSAVLGVACAGYTAYTEYKAGCSTMQIIVDSVFAGLAGFNFAYSLGLSGYQLYLNYCYLNGLNPVTDISFSNNVPAPQSQVPYNERHQSGLSSPDLLKNPPKNGSYIKFDDKGNIYSYAQFDSQGRQTLRIDFQGKPHNKVLPPYPLI